MKLLAQLQPRICQSGRVMTPVGPARGNGHDDRVQEGNLPQVLENLRVFVVLNAITDGLQSYARSRLGGSDGSRRIEEDSVTWSAQAAAASGGIHIVPTAHAIARIPSAASVLKDSLAPFRPIE